MNVNELKEALRFEAGIVRQYRERIASLRTGCGNAPELASVPVQGGVNGDPVSRAACEIMRLEGEIQGRIDRIYAQYLVHCDTQEQREVLRLRYIHWMRFEKIALDMKYSVDHVFTLHRQAITAISEKLLTLA